MDCGPPVVSGKNTGVGCRALLQGIFSTQWSNLYLLWPLNHRQVIYRWVRGEPQVWCSQSPCNQMQVHMPNAQWGQTEKLVWGSEKGLLQGHARRMGDLCPGNSELLEWFQENIFKGHVVGVEGWVEGVTGHVISLCTILWLDDGEVTSWCHSSYHYQSLGVGLGVMCSQSSS